MSNTNHVLDSTVCTFTSTEKKLKLFFHADFIRNCGQFFFPVLHPFIEDFWTFTYAQLSQGPVTTFQLGLGSLSYQWPCFSHALVVRQMVSHLSPENRGHSPLKVSRSHIITMRLRVGMRCFCWNAELRFLQTWCWALRPNIGSHLSHRTLF